VGSPTEDIKAKLDIAEVIQEYVKLTRAGTNYKGLCPFHREKTPSFMVSSDKQIFHCFGCGEGGDVFSFVMKIEGVEFPEALRVLAAKAGVKLEPRNPQLENQKTKLLDINRLAAAYFHKVLLESSQAAVAREYVKKRGLSELTIEEFKIGYSVEDWEALQSFLLKKGYTAEEIFDAGLSIKKERGDGYYDRFRGRLMFPLADVHGQIVGFGGRILVTKDGTAAKYVNTPQTAVYNKSALLFALDRAKKEIQKQKLAVVVEGYMDALSSHQAGVENVVASSGTALTQEQVRLLRRYCQTAALAFDTDPAGSEATRRGLEIAWQHELETRIVELPFGKDPDECIQKDPAAWKQAIANARPFMEFYFDKTFKETNLATVEGKKQAARILLPLISHLPDQIEQTHYLQKLASAIHVEERHLRDRLPKARQAPATPATTTPTVRTKDRVERLSELVLGIALKYPEHLEYIIQNVQPEYLKGEGLAELYKTVVIYYTKATSVISDELFAEIARQNSQLSEKAKTLILLAESIFEEQAEANEYRKALIEAVPVLKKQYLSRTLRQLQDELTTAEAQRDQPRIQTLLENITSLTEELGHLS